MEKEEGNGACDGPKLCRSSPCLTRTCSIAMTNKTLDKHLELTQIALSDTYTGEGLPTVVSLTQRNHL